MVNGFTAYKGPSEIDGKPIRMIATGTQKASVNVKTSDMIQTWILADSCKPTEAIKTGADVSVCGACPHRPAVAKRRGMAPCYVNAGQAPNGVYRTTYGTKRSNPRNVPTRLGSYGEPTAVPFETVKGLLDGNGHTGYTHRWRECDQRFRNLLMASVDSEAEAWEARAKGWRTFRVRKPADGLMAGEIACPASKEGGLKTTCNRCLLCAGTSTQAKNVAIIEH